MVAVRALPVAVMVTMIVHVSMATQDDGPRCRSSGICDDAPALHQCMNGRLSSPLPTAASPLARARDAELACTFDPAARALRVREATRWAFKGYRDCAWGQDELRPLSCSSQHWLNLTLTAVDALDTLYLLDLMDEFSEAATMVLNTMHPSQARDCNLFETTIRIVGGLLAAAHLSTPTNPDVASQFVDLATEVGMRLSKGFKSPSGIPFSDVDLATGSTARSVPLSSTSEVGTLSLEYTVLARLTGKHELETDAMAVHNALTEAVKEHDGLLPMYVSPADGKMGQTGVVMLGARTDSYYEYLLKQWILTGRTDTLMLERYKHAMAGVRERLLRRSKGTEDKDIIGEEEEENTSQQDGDAEGDPASQNATAAPLPVRPHFAVESGPPLTPLSPAPLLYVAERHAGRVHPKMDHLVCFLPGLFALGDYFNVSTVRPDVPGDPSDLDIARELVHTCYQLYRRTPSGLAPEIAHFEDAQPTGRQKARTFPQSEVGGGDIHIKRADAHSLLRPETVESMYLLWKTTGDPAYREQAWRVFRAVEMWSKVEGMQHCLAGDPFAAATLVARETATRAATAAVTVLMGVGNVEPKTSDMSSEIVAHQVGAYTARSVLAAYEMERDATSMALVAARAAVEAAVAAVMGACNNDTGGFPGVDTNSIAPTEAERDATWADDSPPVPSVSLPPPPSAPLPLCSPETRGGGYTSLESVSVVPPPRRDKMESFYLSETLKYLYLIFSEPPDRCLHPSCNTGRPLPPARLPLSRFVFNTEAHPLPVAGPAGTGSLLQRIPSINPFVLNPYGEKMDDEASDDGASELELPSFEHDEEEEDEQGQHQEL